MTKDFQRTMQRLNGLRFAPTDLGTHWEALSDVTIVELEAAVGRAAKECDEFPSPKQLLAFIDERRAAVIVPEEDPSRAVVVEARTITTPDGQTHTFDREWRYYDEECSDTGVRSYWCGDRPSVRQPWLTVQRCARQRPHLDHEWVDACPCSDTNPAVLRKKARAQQVTRKTAAY